MQHFQTLLPSSIRRDYPTGYPQNDAPSAYPWSDSDMVPCQKYPRLHADDPRQDGGSDYRTQSQVPQPFLYGWPTGWFHYSMLPDQILPVCRSEVPRSHRQSLSAVLCAPLILYIWKMHFCRCGSDGTKSPCTSPLNYLPSLKPVLISVPDNKSVWRLLFSPPHWSHCQIHLLFSA